LTLSRTDLIVPFQEARTVRLGGVATGEIAVAVEDARIAEASVDLEQATLRVSALAPGVTTLRVRREGAVVVLRILVRKYAGRYTGPVTAEITGRPAPATLVAAAAIERCREAFDVELGATVRLLQAPSMSRALEPGSSVSLRLLTVVEGKGYLPRKGEATVLVRNRPLPPREADVLLYSNDPEQVRRFGLLYHGRLEPQEVTRLLYHHQNRMSRALYLSVDLVNTGGELARLQLIEGVAQPIVDTVLVGHRAGVRFMQHSMADIGTVIEVPAGKRRSILLQRVPTIRTASGILGLRALSGPGLHVEVTAAPEPVAAATRPANLRMVALSDHVYPRPKKELSVRYRVGERWAFVSVGKRAIDGRVSERRLDGNYGVFYDIAVQVENPTAVEQTINLVLAAEAGGARGVFLVDGRIIEVPQISPPAERVIASYRLQPGMHGSMSIRTLPVGGSAYPVTLVVRTRRPGDPRLTLRSTRRSTTRMTEVPVDEMAGN
jgi:hypothetical protein